MLRKRFLRTPPHSKPPVAGCCRVGSASATLKDFCRNGNNISIALTRRICSPTLSKTDMLCESVQENHGVDVSSSDMVAAGEFSSRFSKILTADFIYFPKLSFEVDVRSLCVGRRCCRRSRRVSGCVAQGQSTRRRYRVGRALSVVVLEALVTLLVALVAL